MFHCEKCDFTSPVKANFISHQLSRNGLCKSDTPIPTKGALVKRKREEELAAAAQHAMQELEEAAKRAEEETKRAEAEQERERQLRYELQENIINTAHDIKSPTTALGLAVESLLDALDNNKPLSESVRHRVIETLHGMAHTISTVNMIINRSVVREMSLFSFLLVIVCFWVVI